MNIKTFKSRLVSAAVLCAFFSTQTAWAAPGIEVEVMPERETPAFLKIDIPPRLADVEEIYEAPPKVDPSLIVHVQNAHGNYDAQVKIKELMKYLYEKYNFRLFFVEGAVERLNPDYLRLFPDNAQNVELADKLAREGKITGAEFFLVEAPSQVQAVGIEHAKLYRENYEAFKEVYAGESIFTSFLSGAEARLDRTATKTFSRELRQLVSEWKRFEAGHRDFLPYVQRLSEDAAKYLDIHMNTLFAQVQWPQITRLLLLQSMEKDLNLEAGREEKEKVVKVLRRLNVSKEVVDAVEDLEQSQIRMNRLSPEDERMENLPRHLIERLTLEAGPKGFHFKDYPQFSLYAGYQILKSEIDSRALFDEIDLLFQKILDKAATNREERMLLELYRDAALLHKLFSLDLTREQWQDFSRKQSIITPDKFFGRIAALDQGPAVPGDKEIFRIYETAMKFYSLAQQREAVFYYTVKKGMTSESSDKATLLTGGFHTAGVFERFRADQVNYGILMPKIQGEISKQTYVETMLDTHPSMFKTATLEQPLLTVSVDAYAAATGAAGQELANVEFAMAGKVLESAITTNLDFIQKGVQPGVDYYRASEFVDVYNASPAARSRHMQLVRGTSGIYLFHNGEAVKKANQFEVINVVTVHDAGGVSVEALGPSMTMTTEAPPVPPVVKTEERIVMPPPADSVYPIPEEVLTQAVPAIPAAAPIGARNNLLDFSTMAPLAEGILLGPGMMAHLGLAETRSERRDKDVAALLAGGTIDLTETDAPRIMNDIIEFHRASGTDVARRLEEALRSLMANPETRDLVSDKQGLYYDIRSTMPDDNELIALAAELTFNPQMRRAIVFVSENAAELGDFAKKLHARMAELFKGTQFDVSALNSRLAVIAALPKKAAQEIQRHYAEQGKMQATAFVRDGILRNVVKNLPDKLPFNGLLIESAVLKYPDTQSYIAGTAAKRNLAQPENTDFRDFSGVLLREGTVSGLQKWEMQEEGLDAFHARIAQIVNAFRAAVQLQAAA